MTVIEANLNSLCDNTCIKWNMFKGSTILVTGATGLIGSAIVKSLLFVSNKDGLNLKVISMVRDEKKAKDLFNEFLERYDDLVLLNHNICDKCIFGEPIDYIIHCASPTASSFFIENPIQTIETIVNGTRSMLKLAKEKNVKSFVYLSSMEVYGSPKNGELLTEEMSGDLNTMSVRNCYPIAKQLAENMCRCYFEQYSINAKIIRLAQTFGPGVEMSDNRVFAYFAKCALKKEDIVLETAGTSSRMYLHVYDAISAILTVLLSGKNGQIYNAANSETYCSIYEMAKLVAYNLAKNQISINVISQNNKRYPPEHYLKLDIKRLKSLGWYASKSLADMYFEMMEEWSIEKPFTFN